MRTHLKKRGQAKRGGGEVGILSLKEPQGSRRLRSLTRGEFVFGVVLPKKLIN